MQHLCHRTQKREHQMLTLRRKGTKVGIGMQVAVLSVFVALCELLFSVCCFKMRPAVSDWDNQASWTDTHKYGTGPHEDDCGDSG